MAIQTFTQMAAQYDPAIATGVNTVLANAVAANAQAFTEAMTIYILVIGCLFAFGEMEWRKFVKYMSRGAMVSALLVLATFNQLIAEPAMNGIPNWIAQAINGPGTVASAPQQFDLIWSATKHLEASILSIALGFENIGYQMAARLDTGLAGFLLTVVFWCYEFSRAVMGLIIVVLYFSLFLYLFETTRGIPLKIVGMGISILILQLMLAITVQLTLKGNSYILVQAATSTSADLDSQLGAFEDVLVWFLFGAGLVVIVPGIAAFFGGGVALGVGGPIMSAAGRAMGMGARGAAGAIGAAGRAGSQATGRAISRMRS